MPWYTEPCALPCEDSAAAARNRQENLTKPPGSLGRLEDLAAQFAAWQGQVIPQLHEVAIRVFAGDHGVCAQGVSAFPSEVTAQMIANFLADGAAISVLARSRHADFAVVNMGTLSPIPDAARLVNVQLAPGSRDFTIEAAMTADILDRALEIGAAQIESIKSDLFIAGEMGIGNTTAASALLCALLGLNAGQAVGRGTGVDDNGLARKRSAVSAALALHGPALEDPYEALRRVGGLEIAGMCGAFIRAAQRGIPILLDGFIATAAALVATRLNPGVGPWLLAGHCSAEQAHRRALDSLALDPLLDLGMRLGEGSGAAVALPLLEAALLLHADMATFEEAGVASSGE